MKGYPKVAYVAPRASPKGLRDTSLVPGLPYGFVGHPKILRGYIISLIAITYGIFQVHGSRVTCRVCKLLHGQLYEL